MDSKEEINLLERREYRRALRDVYNWFYQNSEAIKHYKLGNFKCMLEIIDEMMMYPEPLMMFGENAKYKGGVECRKKMKKTTS